MRLSMIVAMSVNGVIGNKGKLPWSKIPEDMANFKRLTMGHALIMGRKTYESIGGPLGGRRNIILSRSKTLCESEYRSRASIAVARTPIEAIDYAMDAPRVDNLFVIGGAEIYRLFGPLCDEAFVTTIRSPVDGDTYFPLSFAGNPEWDSVSHEQWTPNVEYRHYLRKPCQNSTTPDT